MTDPYVLDPEERARIVAVRRDLHMHPELGFEEHRTSGVVRELMGELGYAVRTVARTGVVAVLEGERPGPTLLLRADMDALPVLEENTHGYVSTTPGRMHACGHDGHTSILLWTARKLAQQRDRIAGRVVFLFQPAEEGLGGARAVLDSGLLEELGVDACVGLHLWSETPTGTVIATPGPFMASTDRFEVVVHGRGGHAAIPHHAVDPVVAAAHMVVALQTIVSRNVDPEAAAVVTVGSVQAGRAVNVIPDEARIGGTVRTYDQAVQERVEAALSRIVEGIGRAHGCDVEVSYERVTIPTVNDPALSSVVEACAEAAGIRVDRTGFRTMAGEDMAFLLDRYPGVFFFLGAQNPEVGAVYPHHHPRFEIDEAALPLGVDVLCRVAERLTNDGLP